jgi:hypothetical protein
VHRDSQQGLGEVGGYIEAVHALVMQEAEGRDGSYFNANLNVRPRPWSRAELEKKFNPELSRYKHLFSALR